MATINFNGQDVWVGTNETKEQFAVKAEQKAKNYEALSKFWQQVFKPVLRDFNGKALNNRFIVALQQKALEVDENIVIGSLNKQQDNTSYLHVETTYADWNSAITICIVEQWAGSDERLINEAATRQRNKGWRNNETKEQELLAMADGCRRSIEHYDDYMQQVAQLRQLLDKYNEVPTCFHQHIVRDFLHTY